jgi:multidrug efflux system membrane fusion protein
VRTVTVSANESGQAVIASGLTAGEIVVTSGLDRLRPGAKVSTGTAADKPGAKKPE